MEANQAPRQTWAPREKNISLWIGIPVGALGLTDPSAFSIHRSGQACWARGSEAAYVSCT
jgi:hypothetical protein